MSLPLDRPATIPRAPVRLFAGPFVLLATVVAYAAATGLGVTGRASFYTAYLVAPAVILLATPRGGRLEGVGRFAAVLALWLPIEARLLPPLPMPNGYDIARFFGLLDGLYLFLFAWPLDGVGLTLRLRAADLRTAILATIVFSAVALPIGLATDFIVWNPRLELWRVLLTPPLMYLVTALPEEFLFRGLIQNLLRRSFGVWIALVMASVIFGLAHFPDPRYIGLATAAGFAYGWVYQRTGKITASAITHALVDIIWVLLFRG
jgi:uncharacterized protein